MEKDLDKKLYNEYLKGDKEAFNLLYNKYRGKIEYFVYNILKDYSKAEDITQETFMYIMQNPIKEGYPFRQYAYLVAKSRAYNYIKVEKRRNEISEQYINHNLENVESDVLEDIEIKETKKELLNAIDQLEEKYKNAI